MDDKLTQLYNTYRHRRAVQRSFHDQHCQGARQARQARRAAFRRYYEALQPQADPFAEVNEMLFGSPAGYGSSLSEYALLLTVVAGVSFAAVVLLSDWVLALWERVPALLQAMGG